MSGQVEKLAAHDFDSAGTIAMLDPARAKDDQVLRVYRQLTAGSYTATFGTGVRMRLEGVTADEIGVRPSKLQFDRLMAMVNAVPPPGVTPTQAQLKDLLESVAGLYEGVYLGGAEIRGLSIETPEGPFRLAAIRLGKLDNGKLAEFALEGLDARVPQGPVKVGRFALKSLDIANLMRLAGEFSVSGRDPAPEQLAALALLLEGTELQGLVAPYKATDQPINIDTLNLSWGQFVGPIPTRARTTLKMSGPVDLTDPEPFRSLAGAGIASTSIAFDLGAAWAEGTRAFALEPVTLEVGSVLAAAASLSVANVPREVFSINPLQVVMMAAQIEAGRIELRLSDIGGVIRCQPVIERNRKDKSFVFVEQAFPGARIARTAGPDQITIRLEYIVLGRLGHDLSSTMCDRGGFRADNLTHGALIIPERIPLRKPQANNWMDSRRYHRF